MKGKLHPQFANLIEFLKTLQTHRLLDEPNIDGKIVYADDQFVNQSTV